MNQHYVGHKIVHFLNKNSIFVNKFIRREYSCLLYCNSKYNLYSAGYNLTQHQKLENKKSSYFGNTTCRCCSKTTKPEDKNQKIKNLIGAFSFSIVENYQKLKRRLALNNKLRNLRVKDVSITDTYQKIRSKLESKEISIWGAVGLAAYLTSLEVGNAAYVIATLPVGIFHLDSLKILCSTFKRDVTFAHRYMKARLALAMEDKTLGECFSTTARLNVNEVMMYFEDTRWTFSKASLLANKVSNYFLSLNYERGDVVALMVTNRPEYIALLIGLSRLGVPVALINTSFKSDALSHSINVSKCKGIVVSEDMLKEFEIIKSKLNSKIEVFQLGGKVFANKNYRNLSNALINASDLVPETIHKVCENDPLLYIYTSNATTLPKVAMLSHSKFIANSVGIAYLLDLRRHDTVYVPLPLHHSIGIIAGAGPAMVCGIPIAIRRKFSAIKFWTDCIKYRCTAAQYVGDICRYLYLQPPTFYDTTHSVKKMIGSGLNKTIWNNFVNRFNVQMIELYGAVEGNFNMINIDGKAGAVGFVPSFLPKSLHPASVIKVDSNTLEPIRNNDGLCQRGIGAHLNPCGEAGMLIGMIKSSLHTANCSYETNSTKVIENVFKKGDKAYLTGDLIIMDKLGYMYFIDRVDDIYRCKGKTVVTAEVESVIEHLTDHSECAVYGVPIPGTNKKVGMVIIGDPHNNINLNVLAREINRHLPHFSRPLFLRLTKEVSSYKTKKRHYIEEGFNPEKIADKLYYFNERCGSYQPLTIYIYRNMVNKTVLLDSPYYNILRL